MISQITGFLRESQHSGLRIRQSCVAGVIVSSKETARKQNDLDRIRIRAYSAPVSFETIEQLFFARPSPHKTLFVCQNPSRSHPALLVLLAVFFISLTLSLWGGALFPIFTTLIGGVLVGTAVAFLILYTLVWLARKIYARLSIPFQGANSLTLHPNNSSSKSSRTPAF